MDIFGTHIIHGSQGITAPHQAGMFKKANTTEVKPGVVSRDEVEISSKAQRMTESREVAGTMDNSDIRLDLVNRIRAEIANGTYETPEKLEIAMERLLNRIS